MPETKPKRLPSCDACRQRKIKCERPPGHGLSAVDLLGDGKDVPVCTPCSELGVACTYKYRRQRRGPPSQYLKRFEETKLSSPHTPREHLVSPQVSRSTLPSGHPCVPQAYPVAYDRTAMEGQVGSSSHTGASSSNWIPDSAVAEASLGPDGHLQSISILPNPMMASAYTPYGQIPRDPQTEPYTGHSRLEDFMGRDTAIYVLSLFFDYVHPLIPCIHQPTFMAQVQSRLEERSDIFYSLLMSILASTLAQVPKSLVPVESHHVGRLAEQCHLESRAVSIQSYDPPSLELVVIRFCDAVYFLVNGRPGANVACVGESQQIAVTLGLHQEETYVGLDPIDTEMRRRVFSLVFNADKAMACLRNRPIFLRSEECNVAMPRELDDEYITREGYLEQPPGTTSIMTGLNVATRIFTVLGDIMTLQREARRLAPIGSEGTLSRLREVAALTQRLLDLTRNLPPDLQLKKKFQSSAASPADDWGLQALTQLELYFNDAGASRDLAKDNFLVSQGNIFVTHAMARFVLLQYRDELLAQSGEAGSTARTATERVLSYTGEQADCRRAVLTDLLDALHNIPIQSLAVNGASLVRKVRYVAVTLLDPATAVEVRDEDAAKSHSYLLDYLTILSEIEKNLASQHQNPQP